MDGELIVRWAAVGLGGAVVYTALGWRRAFERVRRLEAKLGSRGLEPDAQVQLAQQIEDLALQVERLSEGQDFLSRVIAQRTIPVHAGGREPQTPVIH